MALERKLFDASVDARRSPEGAEVRCDVLGHDRFGSSAAYRSLPIAGLLYGLEQPKRARMSGLGPTPVVLVPDPEGQSVAHLRTSGPRARRIPSAD
jgi:hypothetical protein